MEGLTAKEIRKTFIDFFVEKKGHKFVPSSSTIPHDDPTLLFANAGMNQFKPIFLGTVDPRSDMATWKSAANTQKCIRAGGKHNDLDDVGKDVYHHTFFEMLGNWSFGDYFKKEAIEYAWELLTKVYKLDPSRLYVSYFGGDEAAGLEPDYEARDIWLSVGVPAERVLPYGMKENFWEMGETGPCGPCSEIHYDRIGGRNVAHLVNADDPDVLEIWNNVFIQFNREADRSLRLLPKKHVDTGMGLERLVSVLQDKRSNYDTDIFVPIFEAIQHGTGSRPYTGKVGKDDVDGIDMAYRVVADHIRTLTIALSDGGMPSSVGRGYVLRRILRRAIRYAAEKLKAEPGFFASLVYVVAQTLGDVFPEVAANTQNVIDIINEEEAAFRKTLERGRRLFDRAAEKAEGVIPGDVCWKLYDTYGFPIDLTEIMASERNMKLDVAGYEAAKQRAIEMSRKDTKGAGEKIDLDVHAISELKGKGIPATDDSPKYIYTAKDNGSEYDFASATGNVVAIRTASDFISEASAASEGVRLGVVLDKTNFYAEQGGQTFDIGFFNKAGDEEFEFVVEDTQNYGGYVLHVGQLTAGSLKVGEAVTTFVDKDKRRPTMNNHTATHMTNFALRSVLGDEVAQKGSIVYPDRFRFDFSHNRALTIAEIAKVEELVGQFIARNDVVYKKEVPLATAKQIYKVAAMFGEVYPDPVRVVCVGFPIEDLVADPSNQKWGSTSVEFCGGTHLLRAGDMKQFTIVGEEAIAKGIRRLTALTGSRAAQAYELVHTLEVKLKEKSKLPLKELSKEIPVLNKEIDSVVIPAVKKEMLKEELKKLKKMVDDQEKEAKAQQVKEAVEKAKQLMAASPDAPFYVDILSVGGNTKAVSTALKESKSPALFITVDSEASKVYCLAEVPKDKAGTLKANEWVTVATDVLGGKCGGRDVSAQGTGSSLDKIDEALELCRKFAATKLGL
eukprot:Colp12_sorted_trinity150504_noHs@33595